MASQDPGRVLAELALHVGVAVGGFALFVTAPGAEWQAVAVGVGVIGLIGVGLNSHTASHYATSDRRWLNEALVFFGYPGFLGLSATYWWHSHVAVHHRHPAVIGIDDDLDLAPAFAVTDLDVERARGLRRFYYERCQWLVFPLALLLNGPNMTLTGWRFLLGALRDPARRRAAHWIDLGALGLHWLGWVILPLLWLPADDVAAFYGLRLALAGYVMFAVFAPAHFPAEVAGVQAGATLPGFATLQTAHTLNYDAGRLGRFFVAGLDHQIEHHLFPGVSHVHYPRLAPLVEAFCRRHGLPYRRLPWPLALWKAWHVFRVPKRVVRPRASA
jgi:fatty acid desaturase